MVPFKYLEISNHVYISNRLCDLILNSVYANKMSNGDIEFSFRPRHETQKKYNILHHQNFWNFLNLNEVLELIPELDECFKKIKIQPFNLNLLVVNEGYGILHTDGGPRINNLRINWPVYNCHPQTRTVFYKLKSKKTIQTDYDPPTIEDDTENLKTKFYDTNEIDYEIGYYNLTQPVLINYTIPHAVKNPDDIKITYPRILMSVDFTGTSLKL